MQNAVEKGKKKQRRKKTEFEVSCCIVENLKSVVVFHRGETSVLF